MRRELGMFVALGVLCLGLWWSNPAFVGQVNIFNTSRQIGMLGIFAIGLAFVIITGGIDLSVGSVIGLTGVLIAKLCTPASDPSRPTLQILQGMGMPVWAGIAIALGVALFIGLVQGLLITRLNLQPFIVTLGFMLLLRGVSQTIVAGGNITIIDAIQYKDGTKVVYPALSQLLSFVNEGLFYVNGIPILSWPVVICLVVIAVASYLLHFSVFGRYVFAIGGSRDAAQYSGIPVKRVETLTYVICAGLAGLAGVLNASYITQMSQGVGESYELIAIAGAVLGGCSLRGGEGTILGVMIGSTIMRIIENGFNFFRIESRNALGQVISTWKPNENWKNIIIGAVILIAVILDQVVHIVQARRRTRKAGAAAPPSPSARTEALSSEKP